MLVIGRTFIEKKERNYRKQTLFKSYMTKARRRILKSSVFIATESELQKLTLIQRGRDCTMAETKNRTENGHHSYLEEHRIHIEVFVVIDSFVAVLTVISNIMFLTALRSKRSLHTPSNILLGALSLSDLLVGFVVQPLWIVKFCYVLFDEDYTVFDYPRFFITWFAIFLSFTYMVTVSINRYVAVSYPLWYHAKATCRTHLVLVITVFSSSIFLYSLGQMLFVYLQLFEIIYSYYAFMCLFLAITGYCNAKIFMVTQSQRREIRALQNVANQSEFARSGCRKIQEKNRNVIILLITTLFYACYVPFLAQKVQENEFDIKKPRRASFSADHIWIEFLLLSNSLLNPIVFFIWMRSFRQAIKVLICKRTISNR